MRLSSATVPEVTFDVDKIENAIAKETLRLAERAPCNRESVLLHM